MTHYATDITPSLLKLAEKFWKYLPDAVKSEATMPEILALFAMRLNDNQQ